MGWCSRAIDVWLHIRDSIGITGEDLSDVVVAAEDQIDDELDQAFCFEDVFFENTLAMKTYETKKTEEF